MTRSPTTALSAERRAYFDRLGHEPGDDLARALDRAHDLRRFEIENYWKRSTYFWGFQLAAFAALAIARQSGQLDPIVLMIVSILGMATSMAAIQTARGSKFWQRNWEYHVDYLEDEIEGKLHKTALAHDGKLAPSVSAANERLHHVLLAGWSLAFAAGAVIYAAIDPSQSVSPSKAGVLALLSSLAVAAVGWIAMTPKSALRGRAFHARIMKPL